MKKSIFILLSLLMVFTACAKASIYNDGQYEGTGQGKYGPIVVKVEVKSDKITKVLIVSHSETPGISDPAIQGIPLAIIEKQNTKEVDVFSGATVTSQAILDAVDEALKEAMK
ncbi:MAG: hypothetical protein A2Y20_08155 [Firmicutes bacterium GWF2_51_9]|nr:MAG: hypothetical protein A2Y20_08155 [Firmicutes bacterium GWF2_51_9]OGS58680.1 MAG: hypothetical protein A2Y19_03885 [Firmicutes bacterium GWE2_51_13]HAM62975.1 FMN-binding protein [Erysipelotrichaceae bacterium]HBZ40445.1 FMN-binding protein [Erysipelotrichaceae bacterium]